MATTSPDTPAGTPPAPAPAPAPEEHVVSTEPTIEADEDDGYVSNEAASLGSTSMSSSVRDYNFENGRRYHKFQEGTYHFPNDEPEKEREDMKHAMIVHLCQGKLHYAPLENPQMVLDLGTGTGIWAIDMGDEYPSAEVLGVDLSPIQPNWVPPNVRFIVDDISSSWVYPKDHFDLVHARHMASSLKNWEGMLAQAFEHIKPGGWVELQELRFVLQCDDGSMTPDYAVEKWFKTIKNALDPLGVDLLAMERNAERVRAAGFTNVSERIFKVPLGHWPRDKRMKTIGIYNRSCIWDGLQAISIGPMTRGLGWTATEVELFLVDVRKALLDSSHHVYLPFHVVYGQKPE